MFEICVNGSLEKALRSFTRAVKRSGLIDELKRRRYFMTPSERRRKKRHKAALRRKNN